MAPLYTVVAWLAAAAHFAFLVYLPLGGFLALRLPRTIWMHLAAVLWALASVAWGLACPLTAVERWARAGAGMAPMGPAGFIDHYITSAMFPSGGIGYLQAAVFAAVALSWAAYGVRARRPAGAAARH
jgi:hypothetical protein